MCSYTLFNSPTTFNKQSSGNRDVTETQRQTSEAKPTHITPKSCIHVRMIYTFVFHERTFGFQHDVDYNDGCFPQ